MKYLSKFIYFHSTKTYWRMSSGKCRPFCLGLNVLTVIWFSCAVHICRVIREIKTPSYLELLKPADEPCCIQLPMGSTVGYPQDRKCLSWLKIWRIFSSNARTSFTKRDCPLHPGQSILFLLIMFQPVTTADPLIMYLSKHPASIPSISISS